MSALPKKRKALLLGPRVLPRPNKRKALGKRQWPDDQDADDEKQDFLALSCKREVAKLR